MIGIHIPQLCTSVSSNCLRSWFKHVDIGTVSIIKFDNLNLGTATRSGNVYFRKLYDIPRTHQFIERVKNPNKQVFFLYKKQMLEFKPIIRSRREDYEIVSNSCTPDLTRYNNIV